MNDGRQMVGQMLAFDKVGYIISDSYARLIAVVAHESRSSGY